MAGGGSLVRRRAWHYRYGSLGEVIFRPLVAYDRQHAVWCDHMHGNEACAVGCCCWLGQAYAASTSAHALEAKFVHMCKWLFQRCNKNMKSFKSTLFLEVRNKTLCKNRLQLKHWVAEHCLLRCALPSVRVGLLWDLEAVLLGAEKRAP